MTGEQEPGTHVVAAERALLRLSVTKTWSTHEDSPRTLPTNSSEWRAIRQQVLQRDNYTCRFCGIRAKKHLICDHIDGNASHNDLANLRMNCPMCDSVRHCGLAGIRNVLSFGISRMSQEDINLKTMRQFSRTRRIPLFSDVDSEAVIISKSTVGYANILLGLEDDFDYTSECDCSGVPHTYDMHKGFFKPDADYMFQNILENRLFRGSV